MRRFERGTYSLKTPSPFFRQGVFYQRRLRDASKILARPNIPQPPFKGAGYRTSGEPHYNRAVSRQNQPPDFYTPLAGTENEQWERTYSAARISSPVFCECAVGCERRYRILFDRMGWLKELIRKHSVSGLGASKRER